MNKSELVAAVAARTGQTQNDVDEAVKALFEVVAEAIGKGDKVTIPGWISFEQTDRSARTGRNPATGETIQIPASKAAKVSAGSKLKAAAKG
ncbi:MAG: HU family DNA-binding protein [Acidimicrobiales bacterium]|nr:HU family DNA-binding protein [Acidimicrobiales bacterium]